MNSVYLNILLVVIGLYLTGLIALRLMDSEISDLYRMSRYKSLKNYLFFIIIFPLAVGLIGILMLGTLLFSFGMHPTNWF